MKESDGKKFLDFLNKHKALFGLGDYLISLKKKIPRRETPVAETTIDRFEKILDIELSTTFLKSEEKRQRSILVHELIHARVLIQRMRFEESVEKIRDEFEEEMINDLEKGYANAFEKGTWD